ncbi:Caspase-1 precursor, putative [Pediculus humanus corporis]|uniref:Caspase-1, putative n=1 Tax=Pediculus humanus subsp. corporis TaxID=121224 RepID=E0VZM6_PEDHC|nr:Caspase-1 precursor, putative [Pediculus humanus corporis]EEB18836.1 Caspase-1 precursor, putative [Pediculus humanus corporis]
MKRLEKVDKNVNKSSSIDNGNEREELSESIIRNISKAFYINSIELVDNGPFIFNDDLRYGGTNLDDDVFIEKEKEFSCGGSQVSVTKKDFHYERSERRLSSSNEDGGKSESYGQGSRRASDVIDSIGDDCVNLRRSLESGGIAIASPRNRVSSDLGYSGSYTSSPAASFSYPPQMYTPSSGGGRALNDVTDSKPFTNIYDSSGVEAVMPVDRDADEYNMYHSRRGRAIIINNDIFDNNLVSPRKGSHVDVENLTNEFTNLGFEVTVFSNMPYYQISEAINEVSKEDHSDADCLMIAVLTHGFDNGYLYARDTIYSIDNLWHPFTADRCLTLAGKPKIFFVQACRGSKVDSGVTLVSRKGSVSETDAGSAAYRLPSHSDFLIAYSCPDGYYSWRNVEDGTWFVQSLVEELRKNGTTTNFLTLLTRVNRRVAVQFSSYSEDEPWLHDKKQVSTVNDARGEDISMFLTMNENDNKHVRVKKHIGSKNRCDITSI